MKPKAREDITEEMVDEDLFLYDEGKNVVHCLNGGAAIIWYLCDGTRDLPAITKEIASTNDLPLDQVRSDVDKAIVEFKELGLLEA